ncbi:hypothetical protein NMY3_02582 [Candidatus Nitrosocosmicus oleophilus]|uniref:Uncharacterized protein n=1 Tax=Candidatus Nitrosocosmicus oleophilus TaxID=1353260 RepID=A0A654M2G6_9ARCH|nr:hypothetical protein NMY3_02582 [Candidatus Nitrosocosmicus oleophilus]
MEIRHSITFIKLFITNLTVFEQIIKFQIFQFCYYRLERVPISTEISFYILLYQYKILNFQFNIGPKDPYPSSVVYVVNWSNLELIG